MVAKARRFGRRYPWEDWFSRGEFVVTRRQHDCTLHGMAQMVRNVAARRRVRVSVRIEGSRVRVLVRGDLDAAGQG